MSADFLSSSKECAKDCGTATKQSNLQSKDSEDYLHYLKGQNSMEKIASELKLTSKHYAPRPSLHELRKQFFTAETTSTNSPFQSFGTSDDLADKRSLNNEPERSSLHTNRNQPEQSTSSSQSTSSQAKQSNNQTTQSKSPSSTILLKAKDDQRERYV